MRVGLISGFGWAYEVCNRVLDYPVGIKRFRLPLFVGIHLLLSGAVEGLFAWKFGHNPRAVVAHLLVLAEWDLALAAVFRALVIVASHQGASWPRLTYRILFAVTCTLQVYLYALDLISNLSWGRNITGHLVYVFAPTIWSGKEPFPVGAAGISAFAGGTLALMMVVCAWGGPMARGGTMAWGGTRLQPCPTRLKPCATSIAVALAMFGACYATITWGIASRDNLLWTHEPIASFFRPDGYAFEPSARRTAVAERDAVLQAAYPRQAPNGHRKNVVLIIVDSLRADRMQVYGYARPTTPFLSRLVQSGCMKMVRSAFSTCSESFCGITSTLASREFRDISAPTFQSAGRVARRGLSDMVPALGQPHRVERAAVLLPRE